MTLPLLGPMTLSGLRSRVVLPVPAGRSSALAALYVMLQLARQRRMLRFANMELLESVAPKQPTRWRHLSAILLVASLVLFTIAMAGPTHDVRIPRNRAVVMLVIDVSQSMRATDVEPNRMAAAQEAAKQFADELTPGINLGLIAYAGTATVLVSADHQPRRDQSRAGQAAVRRPHRHRRGHLHRAAGHRHRRRGDRWRRHPAAGAHRAVLRRQGDDADQPGQPQGRLHRRAHRQGPGRADLDDLVRHPVRLRRDQRPASAGSGRRQHDEEGRRALRRQPLTTPRTCRSSSRSTPRCSSRSATRRSRATPASAGSGWVRWCWRWPGWRRC